MAEDNDSATAVADSSADGATEASDEARAKVQAALDKAGLSPASEAGAPDKADASEESAADDSEAKAKTDDAADPDAQSAEDADDSLEFTPRQREAQKQLGMTDEEVAALGDSAGSVLDSVSVKLTTRMSQLGRLQQRLEAGTAGDEGSNADAPDATESSLGASGKLAFGEDDLDQTTSEDGSSGSTPAVAKLNDMAKRLVALETVAQERQDQEQEATVDAFFAGLWRKGEKDEDVTDFPQFGKGDWSGLAEDSAEHAARDELVKEAARIRRGYAFSHEDLSAEDSLQKALAIVAQDQFREAERKRFAEVIEQRRKSATHRPGQRRSQPVEQTDDETARAKVATVMKKVGLTE